jgi:K(+)-stimulated pyrophosphate-energized sodium pump
MLFVVSGVWSIWLVLVAAVAAFVAAMLLKKKVESADPGNEEMVKVQGYIRDGAGAFIKRQYTTLSFFVAGLAIAIGILYILQPIEIKWWAMVIAYLLGSIASGWAGWLGMRVGVDANAKTAQAATKGLTPSFDVSFFGGAVMGLICAASALGGVFILYFIFDDPTVVLGFSFGASTIALFAKAGGGIYTKTADVAADLVGKIEYSLPEDDPRNPAAVADNVGDNVGDIAGMGADLFDSYVASLIAAMLLGYAVGRAADGTITEAISTIYSTFPLVISASGIIASLVGIFIISKLEKQSPGKALNLATYMATGLFIAFAALFTLFVTTSTTDTAIKITLWLNWVSASIGVLAGLVIGLTTDYFTDDSKKTNTSSSGSISTRSCIKWC